LSESMSEASQVAKRYVRYHYGELANVGEARYDPIRERWEAELLSNYPRIIRDDEKPQSAWIKYLPLRDLGKITLDSKLNVVSATSNAEMSNTIGERLSLLRQRAESIMVRASSLQLAGLDEAKHVLAPIVKVVNNLYFKTKEMTEISLGDLEGEDDDFYRYLFMLEQAGIVIKTKSGFASGEAFIAILADKRDDYDALLKSVISHIIKTQYPVLRSAFNIKQLDKHIRVDNSYYWQAIDAEKPFRARWDLLRERYIAFYNMISVASFRSTLIQLWQTDAIKQEEENENYYYANEALLNDMVGMKSAMYENTDRRA